jgi:hypothetical protein
LAENPIGILTDHRRIPMAPFRIEIIEGGHRSLGVGSCVNRAQILG